jgi:hypothetical protein
MDMPFGSNPSSQPASEIDYLAQIVEELRSIKESARAIREDMEKVWRELDKIEDRIRDMK